MTWLKKPHLLIAALSLTSAAAGAGVGYVAASRILEKRFQERLKTELDDARSYFQNMYSTPVFVADEEDQKEDGVVLQVTEEVAVESEPVDLVGNALAASRVYGAETAEAAVEPGDPRTPPVVVNIFQNPTVAGDEVLDALKDSRDPNFPYIITKEEFYENEPDNEQKKFTYWSGDDILVDDQEELNPIDDIERVVGEDNLLRFGYGSGDEHVLYVRNETLDPPMDLHITRSTGRYAVEVMALDEDEPHIKHSQPRGFRLHDE